MKDWKETIETFAVAWATLALIPGLDFIDIPAILFLKGIFNITYLQMAGIYYLSAIILLIVLAPKKLKMIYYKIKRWL